MPINRRLLLCLYLFGAACLLDLLTADKTHETMASYTEDCRYCHLPEFKTLGQYRRYLKAIKPKAE